MENYPGRVAPDGRRLLFVRPMSQDKSGDLMLAAGGRL